MRKLTIEIDGPQGLDLVNEAGERCNGLTLGELLEQILAQLHKTPRAYAMKTPEEWEAAHARAVASRAARPAPHIITPV